MRFSSCHTSPFILFSKHYGLVQESEKNVLRVRQSCRLRCDLTEELIFQLPRLDEYCLFSTRASSLHLPNPSSLPRVGSGNYMVLGCISSANPQKSCVRSARPVPWAREKTQPPFHSATSCAAGLAFVQVGSWEFSPSHFNVVAACICPQYKRVC